MSIPFGGSLGSAAASLGGGGNHSIHDANAVYGHYGNVSSTDPYDFDLVDHVASKDTGLLRQNEPIKKKQSKGVKVPSSNPVQTNVLSKAQSLLNKYSKKSGSNLTSSSKKNNITMESDSTSSGSMSDSFKITTQRPTRLRQSTSQVPHGLDSGHATIINPTEGAFELEDSEQSQSAQGKTKFPTRIVRQSEARAAIQTTEPNDSVESPDFSIEDASDEISSQNNLVTQFTKQQSFSSNKDVNDDFSIEDMSGDTNEEFTGSYNNEPMKNISNQKHHARSTSRVQMNNLRSVDELSSMIEETVPDEVSEIQTHDGSLMASKLPNNSIDHQDGGVSESNKYSESFIDDSIRENSQLNTSTDIGVGSYIYALYGAKSGGSEWYPGKIVAVNEDGTFAVYYDDGDEEDGVLLKHIRLRDNNNAKDTVYNSSTYPSAAGNVSSVTNHRGDSNISDTGNRNTIVKEQTIPIEKNNMGGAVKYVSNVNVSNVDTRTAHAPLQTAQHPLQTAHQYSSTVQTKPQTQLYSHGSTHVHTQDVSDTSQYSADFEDSESFVGSTEKNPNFTIQSLNAVGHTTNTSSLTGHKAAPYASYTNQDPNHTNEIDKSRMTNPQMQQHHTNKSKIDNSANSTTVHSSVRPPPPLHPSHSIPQTSLNQEGGYNVPPVGYPNEPYKAHQQQPARHANGHSNANANRHSSEQQGMHPPTPVGYPNEPYKTNQPPPPMGYPNEQYGIHPPLHQPNNHFYPPYATPNQHYPWPTAPMHPAGLHGYSMPSYPPYGPNLSGYTQMGWGWYPPMSTPPMPTPPTTWGWNPSTMHLGEPRANSIGHGGFSFLKTLTSMLGERHVTENTPISSVDAPKQPASSVPTSISNHTSSVSTSSSHTSSIPTSASGHMQSTVPSHTPSLLPSYRNDGMMPRLMEQLANYEASVSLTNDIFARHLDMLRQQVNSAKERRERSKRLYERIIKQSYTPDTQRMAAQTTTPSPQATTRTAPHSNSRHSVSHTANSDAKSNSFQSSFDTLDESAQHSVTKALGPGTVVSRHTPSSTSSTTKSSSGALLNHDFSIEDSMSSRISSANNTSSNGTSTYSVERPRAIRVAA